MNRPLGHVRLGDRREGHGLIVQRRPAPGIGRRSDSSFGEVPTLVAAAKDAAPVALRPRE